ncbi:TIGR04282 family arsenosugar biosynthesis glycosyltransferase [Adhaeretor mobilis]|nr:TIGR04282 family arsenosugar biosynthesis glycosyltransferase [Adhaeretor mobilis]
MTTDKCCLGVFAKHWTPGKVKTRLGTSIGDQHAAEVYRLFVATTLARLRRLTANRVVAFSPDEKEAAFRSIATDWNLQSQGSGDLGNRMARFFEAQFAAGYKRVVLLGTDSPNVPLEYIEQAFDMLSENEAVFGPSEDGGYYLVGLSRPLSEAFQGITWSTSEVWHMTQERLRHAGATYLMLPSWYDVDTLADLQRLRSDLANSIETSDSALQELREQLANFLPPNSPHYA